jgi:hypothetical protein
MHKKNGNPMMGGKKHNKKHQDFASMLTPAQKKLPKGLQQAIINAKKKKK